jgi:catechol 2,3-dioxygenase-like lactoylglutathione lyase family enzyme
MARYLESQRVPVAVPATDRATWGVRTAHFVDPAGNLVELLEALPPK